MLGVSGRSFDQWLRPNDSVNMNLLTQIELVGPSSPNPSRGLYKDDYNNFGPAAGFSWQLPWLGKGKTNIRGGYQISYAKPSNLAALVNGIFLNPGFSNLAQTSGPLDGSYFDLRNLPSQIPITPAVAPLQPIPTGSNSTADCSRQTDSRWPCAPPTTACLTAPASAISSGGAATGARVGRAPASSSRTTRNETSRSILSPPTAST